MTFFNQVILTGKVAKPPQFHHQPDGTPVLQFILELDDSKKSSVTTSLEGHQGQTSKRAGLASSQIQVVAMGQLTQSGSVIQSGLRVLVKGRLQERRWKTPEGRHRSRTEVIASELHPDEENEAAPRNER